MYMMKVMLFFVKLLRPQAFYKLSWSHWVGVSNGWAFGAPLSNFFWGFKQENPSRVLDGWCWCPFGGSISRQLAMAFPYS